MTSDRSPADSLAPPCLSLTSLALSAHPLHAAAAAAAAAARPFKHRGGGGGGGGGGEGGTGRTHAERRAHRRRRRRSWRRREEEGGCALILARCTGTHGTSFSGHSPWRRVALSPRGLLRTDEDCDGGRVCVLASPPSTLHPPSTHSPARCCIQARAPRAAGEAREGGLSSSTRH